MSSTPFEKSAKVLSSQTLEAGEGIFPICPLNWTRGSLIRNNSVILSCLESGRELFKSCGRWFFESPNMKRKKNQEIYNPKPDLIIHNKLQRCLGISLGTVPKDSKCLIEISLGTVVLIHLSVIFIFQCKGRKSKG